MFLRKFGTLSLYFTVTFDRRPYLPQFITYSKQNMPSLHCDISSGK